MHIDIATLFIIVVSLCVVVGSILLWAGIRDGGALPLNGGMGLFLVALGITLLLLRGRVPDWISIIVANASLALGFAFMWSVARLFAGERFSLAGVLAGPAAWVVACMIPDFYGNITLRIFLISLIGACYSSAAGWTLWQGKGTIGQARMALVFLCYGHACVLVLRAYLGLVAPPTASPLEGNWLQNLIMLEAPLALVAGCFLAVGMVREHAESELRRNAETDPLTGVLNRRAFWGVAGKCVKDATRVKRPLVLLLFDLDHFKSINDRFGHAVGDQILVIFAETATQATRATDIFGRIGGEEFAALLPGCDASTGRRIAERIRADFSRRTATELGAEATATVSVGIASNGADAGDLDTLMVKADSALYGSKRGGRDRVTDASAAERLPVIRVVSANG